MKLQRIRTESLIDSSYEVICGICDAMLKDDRLRELLKRQEGAQDLNAQWLQFSDRCFCDDTAVKEKRFAEQLIERFMRAANVNFRTNGRVINIEPKANTDLEAFGFILGDIAEFIPDGFDILLLDTETEMFYGFVKRNGRVSATEGAIKIDRVCYLDTKEKEGRS